MYVDAPNAAPYAATLLMCNVDGIMSSATSQDSEVQPAVAPRGSQVTASAKAMSAAGPSSGQVSAGWDPFEVWLHHIERPRQRRAASFRIGGSSPGTGRRAENP